MDAKTFTEGDAVEIQNEPGVYVAWTPATYVKRFDNWKNWHLVVLPCGHRLHVPSRRLRPRRPS